jgi:urease accessory protein
VAFGREDAERVHRAFPIADEIAGGAAPSVHAAIPRTLRSQGEIDLSFKRRGEITAAARTRQAGCLRVRFPRPERPGEPPCAILINTAGGVAEDDHLDFRLEWEDGTVATATTQAAEKIYRALTRPSQISTRLTVGEGASAEWLPQETILFNGARLQRETQVLLAGEASFLGLEAWVLGRRAMGETMRSGALRDRLRIWREGRLVYADVLMLDGDIDALIRRATVANGDSAMAVLVHASASAAALLDPVRAALDSVRGRAAASTWNGLLAVRFLAADGETLRHDIALALGVVRDGKPLPRVWRC